MTDVERRLLIWCAVMLLRSTPLSSDEADEIDRLIAEARKADPAQAAARTLRRYLADRA